jgi:hypothetical protein
LFPSRHFMEMECSLCGQVIHMNQPAIEVPDGIFHETCLQQKCDSKDDVRILWEVSAESDTLLDPELGYSIKRNYRQVSNPQVAPEVWMKGYSPVTKTSHCYMCNRPLERNLRKCICSGPNQMKNCTCPAWQVEHIIAESNDRLRNRCYENMLPACARCNSTSWKGYVTGRLPLLNYRSDSLLACVTKRI